ncbi:MAG: hypothetical protein QXD42_06490 [Nitrososphaerales archaeon]
MIVVRAPLSKAKHKYFTFLCQEGYEYLKAYLESRIAKGEVLTPESPVIAVKGSSTLRRRRLPLWKLARSWNVSAKP